MARVKGRSKVCSDFASRPPRQEARRFLGILSLRREGRLFCFLLFVYATIMIIFRVATRLMYTAAVPREMIFWNIIDSYECF